jgi:hypothetical protein
VDQGLERAVLFHVGCRPRELEKLPHQAEAKKRVGYHEAVQVGTFDDAISLYVDGKPADGVDLSQGFHELFVRDNRTGETAVIITVTDTTKP